MNITVVRTLKLFVMYCSSSFSSEELSVAIKMDEGDELRLIGLPCSGKVDLLYLLKAFEKGADGLVILTCPKNECRHLEGNLRALRRADSVSSILDETGLGNDRITVLQLKEDGIDGIVSEIAAFAGSLRPLAFKNSGSSAVDATAVSN